MTARAFSIRFSFAYALLMLGSGVQLPFLPLWLAAKGIDVVSIGMIVAGMMAVRVAGSPLFAWLADHTGQRRLVIRLCAVGAFLAYALLATLDGFWPIALTALLAGFLFAPVFPLSEGFSVDASVALRIDYGRMRLWASISFLMGSLISGALLLRLDPLAAAWILAGAQGLAVVSALILPPEPEALRHSRQSAPRTVRARKVLFGSSFTALVAVAGLAQASHGVLYTMSALIWRDLGYDTLTIGIFWTAAVAAEVTMFAFSNALVQRFGSGTLLLVGIGGGILRWLGMGIVTGLLPILLLQSLHFASFALTHLATMHLIRLTVPEHVRNRAQGLYSAISGGVLLASTSWASGHLYATLHGHAYFVMAAISMLAMAGALMLLRVSPTTRRLAAA